jgi:hypothetical protein
MKMMHHNATNTARPPSLVDTFGSGFRVLNRALGVLIIPLLIDFWLWQGPRLSLRPLVQRIRAFNPESWDQAVAQLQELAPTEQSFYISGQLPFWRRLHILGTPADAAQVIQPATWFIGDLGTLVGTLLLINLVVTFLTVLYLLPLAEVVRGSASRGGILRRVLRTWLAVLAVIAIILMVLAVIGIPLTAVAMVLFSIVPTLGSAMMLLISTAAIWMIFSTSFAYDAIVLDDAGPITALLASLALVRRYFWSTIGFVLLQTFIMLGLGFIWSALVTTVPGVLIAVVTSAYIGAGVAAAHLVFFRDRAPRMATLPQV